MDSLVAIFKEKWTKNENIEISLFRIGLACFFLIHYIDISLDLFHYYGPDSMIDLELIRKIPLSFLFPFWKEVYIAIAFVLLVVLFLLFALGLLPKWLFPLLFLLQISFHNGNNLIVSESHKLGNIFLFFFVFLPKHSYPKVPINIGWLKDKKPLDHWVKNILIVFLGVYYLFGGLGKISHLLAEEESFLISFFIDKNSIGIFWNYLTIIFQTTFLFLVFTKLRLFVFIIGIFIHLSVDIQLGYQQSSLLYYVWYLILLDRNTFESICALYYRFRT